MERKRLSNRSARYSERLKSLFQKWDLLRSQSISTYAAQKTKTSKINNKFTLPFAEIYNCSFPDPSKVFITFRLKPEALKESALKSVKFDENSFTEDVVLKDDSKDWTCDEFRERWAYIRENVSYCSSAALSFEFLKRGDPSSLLVDGAKEVSTCIKYEESSRKDVVRYMVQDRKVLMHFEYPAKTFVEIVSSAIEPSLLKCTQAVPKQKSSLHDNKPEVQQKGFSRVAEEVTRKVFPQEKIDAVNKNVNSSRLFSRNNGFTPSKKSSTTESSYDIRSVDVTSPKLKPLENFKTVNKLSTISESCETEDLHQSGHNSTTELESNNLIPNNSAVSEQISSDASENIFLINPSLNTCPPTAEDNNKYRVVLTEEDLKFEKLASEKNNVIISESRCIPEIDPCERKLVHKSLKSSNSLKHTKLSSNSKQTEQPKITEKRNSEINVFNETSASVERLKLLFKTNGPRASCSSNKAQNLSVNQHIDEHKTKAAEEEPVIIDLPSKEHGSSSNYGFIKEAAAEFPEENILKGSCFHLIPNDSRGTPPSDTQMPPNDGREKYNTYVIEKYLQNVTDSCFIDHSEFKADRFLSIMGAVSGFETIMFGRKFTSDIEYRSRKLNHMETCARKREAIFCMLKETFNMCVIMDDPRFLTQSTSVSKLISHTKPPVNIECFVKVLDIFLPFPYNTLRAGNPTYHEFYNSISKVFPVPSGSSSTETNSPSCSSKLGNSKQVPNTIENGLSINAELISGRRYTPFDDAYLRNIIWSEAIALPSGLWVSSAWDNVERIQAYSLNRYLIHVSERCMLPDGNINKEATLAMISAVIRDQQIPIYCKSSCKEMIILIRQAPKRTASVYIYDWLQYMVEKYREFSNVDVMYAALQSTNFFQVPRPVPSRNSTQ